MDDPKVVFPGELLETCLLLFYVLVMARSYSNQFRSNLENEKSRCLSLRAKNYHFQQAAPRLLSIRRVAVKRNIGVPRHFDLKKVTRRCCCTKFAVGLRFYKLIYKFCMKFAVQINTKKKYKGSDASADIWPDMGACAVSAIDIRFSLSVDTYMLVKSI